jgi:hypothetical protein
MSKMLEPSKADSTNAERIVEIFYARRSIQMVVGACSSRALLKAKQPLEKSKGRTNLRRCLTARASLHL